MLLIPSSDFRQLRMASTSSPAMRRQRAAPPRSAASLPCAAAARQCGHAAPLGGRFGEQCMSRVSSAARAPGRCSRDFSEEIAVEIAEQRSTGTGAFHEQRSRAPVSAAGFAACASHDGSESASFSMPRCEAPLELRREVRAGIRADGLADRRRQLGRGPSRIDGPGPRLRGHRPLGEARRFERRARCPLQRALRLRVDQQHLVARPSRRPRRSVRRNGWAARST